MQRIIRRCLAKDKEERCQTIKDVAIELKELRRELESTAGSDTTVPPPVSSEGARSTDSILDELVFVGGCTTALLISDPAAAGVRPTFDVDAISEITSYADYLRFSERLRKLGFTEDTSEDAPLCRWQHGHGRDALDEKTLGFSNRWYLSAMASAQVHELEGDLRIRVVTAPYFCATKIEAFRGRGKGDYLSSHDLEDLITVVDGRPELLEEL